MHWLLKAEPDSRIVKGKDVKYTIDDLKEEKIGTWDGVRNNEARKHLMNMKKGDTAFFYRSNCKEPGIVGTMTVVKEHYPDETAHDPNAAYYDPKSPDRWVVVDVEYRSHLPNVVGLQAIKQNPELKDMQLVRRSRLSVIPVTDNEWEIILRMANEDPSATTTIDPKPNNPKPAKPQTQQATKKGTSKTVDKTSKERQREEEETSKPTKRRRTK